MLVNGKKIAEKIYSDLEKKVKGLNNPPGLGILLVGNKPASLKFCSIKIRKCKHVGIFFKKIHLSKNISEERVIKMINKLNTDKKINGIIIQLPLPKRLSTIRLLSQISPHKDVEGVNPVNFAKLACGKEILTVVPAAVIKIIDYYNIKIAKENIVIINDSYLIGKPLAFLLTNRKATVTLCNKYSNLKKYTKGADIIISATGCPHLIKPGMVKKGAVIFDLGFSLVKDKIIGDVYFKKLKNKCRYITPNPGGVGPITVAMLLLNTYKLSLKNYDYR